MRVHVGSEVLISCFMDRWSTHKTYRKGSKLKDGVVYTLNNTLFALSLSLNLVSVDDSLFPYFLRHKSRPHINNVYSSQAEHSHRSSLRVSTALTEITLLLQCSCLWPRPHLPNWAIGSLEANSAPLPKQCHLKPQLQGLGIRSVAVLQQPRMHRKLPQCACTANRQVPSLTRISSTSALRHLPHAVFMPEGCTQVPSSCSFLLRIRAGWLASMPKYYPCNIDLSIESKPENPHERTGKNQSRPNCAGWDKPA